MAGDRATSFGDQAETYDRYRPSYPAELTDFLMQDEPKRAVDVGCGTALASRLLVARGVQVVGVEPDARMAAVAQRHGVDVVVSTFEEWAPAEPFDLLTAAQSWHWVHPLHGPAKAATVLRSGGRFAAFWNNYTHADAIRADFIRVYEETAPHLLDWALCVGNVQADDPLANDGFASALAGTDAFDAITRESYFWERRYDAEAYLAELGTHSDHHLLAPADRDRLFDGLRGVIAAAGGELSVTMRTGLLTGVRK